MRVLILMLSLTLLAPAIADAKLRVAASFWPIAHFAEAVAGERAEVFSITPSNLVPHDFEPSPRDIKGVYDSDVFLYQGAGIDPWAVRIGEEVRKKGVLVVGFAEAMRENLLSGRPTRHALDKAAARTGNRQVTDPHFWLDPVHAATMVTLINKALAKADPEGEPVYRKNMFDYLRQLRALDKEFRLGLVPCELKQIVASHDAYSYLAKRYGFKVLSVKGVSSHGEPSPRHIANLIKSIRDSRIEHIFIEPFEDKRTVSSIVVETGVTTLVLDPLGGMSQGSMALGRTYVSAMRENLDALKKAMKCKNDERKMSQ